MINMASSKAYAMNIKQFATLHPVLAQILLFFATLGLGILNGMSVSFTIFSSFELICQPSDPQESHVKVVWCLVPSRSGRGCWHPDGTLHGEHPVGTSGPRVFFSQQSQGGGV